jgi:hypothetical protein
MWTSPAAISAYVFQIDDRGEWSILRREYQGVLATLSSGKVAPLGTNSWHTAALILQGSVISAEVDGRLVGAVTDSRFTEGNAGAGTAGWIGAEFDNFSVTPLHRPTDRESPR